MCWPLSAGAKFIRATSSAPCIPDFKDERKAGASPGKGEGGWFGLKKAASLVFKVPGAEPAVCRQCHSDPRPQQRLCRCVSRPNGGAVPGDRIVGILTPGEGITIYPIQSPALTAFDDQPERWLDVRWDLDEERKDFFPAQIVVTAINEPGALGTIATVIGEAGANIDHVSFVTRSPDFRDMVLDVEVWDLKHLTVDHFAAQGQRASSAKPNGSMASREMSVFSGIMAQLPQEFVW